MSEKGFKRFNNAEKVILSTSFLLIILSFISESNFHYFQGFKPGLMDPNIFWRAVAAEVFNSVSVLILGILLIAIAFRISKKRKKFYITLK